MIEKYVLKHYQNPWEKQIPKNTKVKATKDQPKIKNPRFGCYITRSREVSMAIPKNFPVQINKEIIQKNPKNPKIFKNAPKNPNARDNKKPTEENEKRPHLLRRH